MQDGARTVVIHEHAAVGVNASGRITCFDTNATNTINTDDDGKEEEVEKGWVVRRLGLTQFLVPGLVDTHIHAPQFSYAGTATDVPLMQWLEASRGVCLGVCLCMFIGRFCWFWR
jgi:guanine deaminase